MKFTGKYLEFCENLSALPPLTDPGDQNLRTNDFLEAMVAWLRDTRGGISAFQEPDQDYILWDDLLKLIQAASIYE